MVFYIKKNISGAGLSELEYPAMNWTKAKI